MSKIWPVWNSINEIQSCDDVSTGTVNCLHFVVHLPLTTRSYQLTGKCTTIKYLEI
jgi:hypothetical protein